MSLDLYYQFRNILQEWKSKKLIWHPLLPNGFIYLCLIKYLISTFKICHLLCGSLFLSSQPCISLSEWVEVTVFTPGKIKNKTQGNLFSRNEGICKWKWHGKYFLLGINTNPAYFNKIRIPYFAFIFAPVVRLHMLGKQQ